MFRHNSHTSARYDIGRSHWLGQPSIAGEWLLVPLHDSTSSSLAVFDTADVAAGPRSVVQLPVTVPVATRTSWQPFL
ncbi:hypothetical protein GCM10011609_27990 [Lentzea pudingi]|uniref:Dioxygenase n=1 Tax=Lentzea pudingi TaxID=1789439 RepID=A0ABQ2HTD7_9PSEU|nr:hypothetical protein [Lentzea pudingi]GGM89487.1 hypothetical protein GCM10011609_27990 [Lentzea pudingi]